MRRQISNEKTPEIKNIFLFIGITPLVLLTILWNNFGLEGVQKIIMVSIVLIHGETCSWYSSRFRIIQFDDFFLYLQDAQHTKIALHSISFIAPSMVALPGISGKLYLVTIKYREANKIRSVMFISKPVKLSEGFEDIPFYKQLKKLIEQHTFRGN